MALDPASSKHLGYQSVDAFDAEKGEGVTKAPTILRRQSSRDGKRTHSWFGHTSHFWQDDAEFGSADFAREIRFGFIRKVYGILTAQMALTVTVAAACMLNDGLREFLVQHSTAAIWLTAIPAVAVLFALIRCKDTYPLNMRLLFLFTALESITIGVLCAVYAAAGYGEIILEAFAITALVFGSLSLFACQTRIDFTVYSGLLTALLTSLIVWGIFCSLFGFTTNGLYSWLGTPIFSGYVVVDTQKIMDKLGVDDYIIAAIELYLDIINLFLFILQILGSSSRND